MTGLNRRHLVLAAGGLAAAPLLPRRDSARAQDAMPTPGLAVRDEILISAADLADALDGSEPPLVIALTEPESFAAGHIVGARQIDWPDLELGATTPEAIAEWTTATRARLGELGITPNADVVIYDGGTLFAARLWWVLDFFGHERKRVLDGGLPAWRATGSEISMADLASSTPPAAPHDYPDNADENRLATLDQIVAALGDPRVALVDARGADEFAAGHIPGAVNINYLRNAAPEDPKTYLSGDALGRLYADAGVTPDQLVIPYCSTGVRSSVTYLALRLAGFPDVALYAGSWDEWGSDPDTPKQQGSS